jgi:hypothetical protein
MRQPDLRHATAVRAWGLHKVRRLTFGIASVGAAGAVILAVGFGGRAHLSQAGQGTQSQSPGGSSQGTGASGSQVPGDGQLQPPPQVLVPAQGPGQVVSGGS